MGSNVVILERKDRLVVAAGSSGPRGEPGPAGVETFTKTASEAISAYRAVIADSYDGALKASNTDTTHRARVIGITETAAPLGGPITIRRVGRIDFSGWSWTPNNPIFVGASGALTQTPPVNPAVFSQIVAVALAATSIYVGIREPISIL